MFRYNTNTCIHLWYCLAVPKLYPQEVYVHSLSSSSVRVTWRGISTSREEETLSGYMVRADDIMTYKEQTTLLVYPSQQYCGPVQFWNDLGWSVQRQDNLVKRVEFPDYNWAILHVILHTVCSMNDYLFIYLFFVILYFVMWITQSLRLIYFKTN